MIDAPHLHSLHYGTLLASFRWVLIIPWTCFFAIINPIPAAYDRTLRSRSNVVAGMKLLLVYPFAEIELWMGISYSLDYVLALENIIIKFHLSIYASFELWLGVTDRNAECKSTTHDPRVLCSTTRVKNTEDLRLYKELICGQLHEISSMIELQADNLRIDVAVRVMSHWLARYAHHHLRVICCSRVCQICNVDTIN